MLFSHLQVTTCLQPSPPYAGADFWLGFSGNVVAVASHPLPSATAGACWRWLLLLSTLYLGFLMPCWLPNGKFPSAASHRRSMLQLTFACLSSVFPQEMLPSQWQVNLSRQPPLKHGGADLCKILFRISLQILAFSFKSPSVVSHRRSILALTFVCFSLEMLQ